MITWMRYRVTSRVHSSFVTPWHRMVRPWGPAAASRLRAQARPDVRETLRELDVDEETRAWFAQAERENSRFVLPEGVMLSAPFLPARVILDHEVGIDIEEQGELAMLQEILSGAWQEYSPGHPSYDFAQELISIEYLIPAEPASLPNFDRPGIHRLQHASLLFRSESAAVVTDPVYFIGSPCSWNRPGSLPPIDAVLISHSHGDHFSLMSLMQFPRETMIVVPAVKTPSILCEDMAAQLRSAGFTNVVEAPWGSVITVKDITIHVYPFYGEQPWVSFAEPVPGFRNSGNTFVLDLLGKKTWLLIDSGPEFDRSMTALCARILEEHGHIDFVMSNLREFHWFPGQIDGSGAFLFCFPIERLERPDQWPYNQLITYGPGGIRELLSTLRPSYFFPYAHWFHALERASHYFEDTGRTEQGLVDAICNPHGRAMTGTLDTEIRGWQVGDHLAWSRGGLSVSSPMLDT